MNSNVSLSSICNPSFDCAMPMQKDEIIVLSDIKPDTFEKKKSSLTAEKVVTATVVGSGVVAKTFPKLKNAAGKVVNTIEKELVEYLNTQGKQIEAIPAKLKGNLTYIPALIGSFGLAALALKDSDKDGKLDVLEMLGKFFNPASVEE